jgi:hypothetical protein
MEYLSRFSIFEASDQPAALPFHNKYHWLIRKSTKMYHKTIHAGFGSDDNSD